MLATLIDVDTEQRHRIGASCRIGRARDNDVVVAAGSVSKWHARVDIEEVAGGSLGPHCRAQLFDTGSRNGTFVNADRVPPHGDAALPHNAVIRFGSDSKRYKFVLDRPPPEPRMDFSGGDGPARRRAGDSGADGVEVTVAFETALGTAVQHKGAEGSITVHSARLGAGLDGAPAGHAETAPAWGPPAAPRAIGAEEAAAAEGKAGGGGGGAPTVRTSDEGAVAVLPSGPLVRTSSASFDPPEGAHSQSLEYTPSPRAAAASDGGSPASAPPLPDYRELPGAAARASLTAEQRARLLEERDRCAALTRRVNETLCGLLPYDAFDFPLEAAAPRRAAALRSALRAAARRRLAAGWAAWAGGAARARRRSALRRALSRRARRALGAAFGAWGAFAAREGARRLSALAAAERRARARATVRRWSAAGAAARARRAFSRWARLRCADLQAEARRLREEAAEESGRRRAAEDRLRALLLGAPAGGAPGALAAALRQREVIRSLRRELLRAEERLREGRGAGAEAPLRRPARRRRSGGAARRRSAPRWSASAASRGGCGAGARAWGGSSPRPGPRRRRRSAASRGCTAASKPRRRAPSRRRGARGGGRRGSWSRSSAGSRAAATRRSRASARRSRPCEAASSSRAPSSAERSRAARRRAPASRGPSRRGKCAARCTSRRPPRGRRRTRRHGAARRGRRGKRPRGRRRRGSRRTGRRRRTARRRS